MNCGILALEHVFFHHRQAEEEVEDLGRLERDHKARIQTAMVEVIAATDNIPVQDVQLEEEEEEEEAEEPFDPSNLVRLLSHGAKRGISPLFYAFGTVLIIFYCGVQISFSWRQSAGFW